MKHSPSTPKVLSWIRSDIEHKLCFPAGRFTSVNTFLSALLAAIFTTLFFAVILFYPDNRWVAMFTQRGIMPYPIVFLGVWTLVILFLKWRKLSLQRKALRISILPEEDVNFVLSPQMVEEVLSNIYSKVMDPKQFVLFHRIILTLENLKNLGRVSDVNDVLRSHADQAESSMETSYFLIGGFLWAIPVMGFIGTVLGLADAIGNFGSVLSSSSNMESIASSLKEVTSGLSIAFETTLIALVIALFLQLLMTELKIMEESFLDECSEYCTTNIVSHLRMNDLEQEGE